MAVFLYMFVLVTATQLVTNSLKFCGYTAGHDCPLMSFDFFLSTFGETTKNNLRATIPVIPKLDADGL